MLGMPDTTTPRHVLARSKRRRRLDLLAVLAALVVTLAAVIAHAANAQGTGTRLAERNCEDFDSQAAAQDFLRDDPSDPDGLDGPPGEGFTGEEGVACESLPAPFDTEPVLPEGEPAQEPEETVKQPDDTPGDDLARPRQDANTNPGIAANRTPQTGGPSLALVAVALVWSGAGLRLASSRLTRKRR